MLQSTFGVMLLAVVEGRPQVLDLKQILQHYVNHRHEVVQRRARFELEKAEARAHLLEGLRVALDHIDQVIEIIRSSASPDEARSSLMAGVERSAVQLTGAQPDMAQSQAIQLSEVQCQAILAMPLQRLTGLERDKIESEYTELVRTIEELRAILASRDRRMQIIKDELEEIRERFGDERRTEIVYAAEEFDLEDLIAEEDMVVTISRAGYIKRMSPRAYRVQNRGGRGVTGMKTKEEDFVEHLFVASTHAYIMFLTSKGQCHWLKVYKIPAGDRASRGRPVVNLLKIEPDEQVAAVVPVQEFSQDRYLFTATRRGIVKKTVLSAYQNIRRDGIIALKILEDDDLIGAAITDGHQDIALVTRNGVMMRFNELEVRSTGRVSTGVKGIGLRQGNEVVDMVVVQEQGSLLTICENGYGKRTDQSEYPSRHRGGMGVIDIKTTERNGKVVACREVLDGDEVMVVTQNGIMIRVPVQGVSRIGRNTQGIKLINLDSEDRVIDMTRVVQNGEGEDEGEEVGTGEVSPGLEDEQG